jgi:hypothetical protein
MNIAINQTKNLCQLKLLNLKCFKSALAFFFLFFLHGTSIENGQQGISYNVIGLGEVAEPEAK